MKKRKARNTRGEATDEPGQTIEELLCGLLEAAHRRGVADVVLSATPSWFNDWCGQKFVEVDIVIDAVEAALKAREARDDS